jgi:peroxiredoxin (alkyl hydroperoxide reductase subunit C)
MYHPLNVGRNMNEILRALEALQISDKYKVAMPLDWKKGDKVIISPPKTLEELEARLADDSIEKVDWYLAKRDV